MRSRISLNGRSKVAFPDGTTRKLHDHWRWRLEEAERRYRDAKNKESRAEYLRVVRRLFGFVVRRSGELGAHSPSSIKTTLSHLDEKPYNVVKR
jgi:hypothetical protein